MTGTSSQDILTAATNDLASVLKTKSWPLSLEVSIVSHAQQVWLQNSDNVRYVMNVATGEHSFEIPKGVLTYEQVSLFMDSASKALLELHRSRDKFQVR